MILSRENILKKTYYGFQIYAYIIKEFFPKEKLLIAQHFKHPVRNPFNAGRRTLHISAENLCAYHEDSELIAFKGDVFDFANKYFKVATNEELYFLINQVMNLGLKTPEEDLVDWLDQEDDTWRPEVSYYDAPVRNVFPSQALSLAEVHSQITSNKFKTITEKLRSITDPKERSAFKANNFPYVTFSGIFKKRSDRDLIKHSLLITFDFDHLPDLEKTRDQLLSDEYFETEMLFVSPSGEGLKWIIKWDRFEGPHREYFIGVSKYIKQKYALETDQSGKDVSRACFISSDFSSFLHKRHRPLW